MAETRKHRVTVRDDIDRAIFAALGEPVLPNLPGADEGSPAAGASPEAAAPERTAAASFVSGGVVGQFTFRGTPDTTSPTGPSETRKS